MEYTEEIHNEAVKKVYKIKNEFRSIIAKDLPIFGNPDIVFSFAQKDYLFENNIVLNGHIYPMEYFEEVSEWEVEYILTGTVRQIISFKLPLLLICYNENVPAKERNHFIRCTERNRNAHLINNINLKYDPSLKIDKDGYFWKPTQIARKSLQKHYLKEQIRARYAFCTRPSNGLSNVVLDSFFPGLLYKYDMNVEELLRNEVFPKTSVCISPLIADLLNVKRLPTEQLLNILGYSIKDITRLLVNVKKKSFNFIFAGVGGTGMNAAYWLDELSKLTNTINIFNSISVYEKENIEFSNILRFPLPLNTYYRQSMYHFNSAQKTEVVAPLLTRLTNRKLIINPYYLRKTEYLGSEFLEIKYKNSDRSSTTIKAKKDTVLYGAPSLNDRNFLSSIGNFICATHASNSCSLWLNPKQTESIEVESYGSIQLGPFMMNQLRMTIGLLELLDSDIPLETQDYEYLNYEFTGSKERRTDRNYNFQIERESTMMTEEQAMAI